MTPISTDLFQHDTIIRRWAPTVPATFDTYGNENGAYAPDATPTKGFVQVDGKSEVAIANVGGDASANTVVADYRIFYPAGVTITEADQVSWDGRILQVIGVRQQQEPGATHHVDVLCREAN